MAGAGADSVARNEPEFGSVLEEDVSGGLLRVDADAVFGDDGRRRRWDLELFGRELEDGRERGVVRNAEDLEGQLRVGRQDDLERHFRAGGHFRAGSNDLEDLRPEVKM